MFCSKGNDRKGGVQRVSKIYKVVYKKTEVNYILISRFMSKCIKQHFLPAAVFITGACVLVVEVVAIRVLSPYFGNTIFTVSSVISVVLAALSLGYYVGGRVADKHPSQHWFFSIIFTSGLLLLVSYVLGTLALPFVGNIFSISSGPLISSLVLFFLPAFLLGTLSPYAVKLQSLSTPQDGIGAVAGKMFFWSTLGSIVGSLLAGFVFIPHIGVDRIMIANGIVLSVLGLVPLLVTGKKNSLES